MRKRNFTALSVMSVLALSINLAHAEVVPVSVDGCAKLARVVYAEVAAAALHGPDRSGPWLIDPGRGDISICSHTARTVSRAFTSAMRSAGLTVRWGSDPIDPGDFCLSGFLSQCYPNRDNPGFSSADFNSKFVQTSWAIVAQSVMRQMHNPVSSDEVRFRDGDLKLQIGLSLRTVDKLESH